MYPSHFIHYKIIGIFAKNSFRFRLDYYFDYYPTTRCPGMPILSAFSSGSKGARTPDLSRVRRTLIPAELCFRVLQQSSAILIIAPAFGIASTNKCG